MVQFKYGQSNTPHTRKSGKFDTIRCIHESVAFRDQSLLAPTLSSSRDATACSTFLLSATCHHPPCQSQRLIQWFAIAEYHPPEEKSLCIQKERQGWRGRKPLSDKFHSQKKGEEKKGPNFFDPTFPISFKSFSSSSLRRNTLLIRLEFQGISLLSHCSLRVVLCLRDLFPTLVAQCVLFFNLLCLVVPFFFSLFFFSSLYSHRPRGFSELKPQLLIAIQRPLLLGHSVVPSWLLLRGSIFVLCEIVPDCFAFFSLPPCPSFLSTLLPLRLAQTGERRSASGMFRSKQRVKVLRMI